MLTSAWLSDSCPELVAPGARGPVDLCGQDPACAPWVQQRGCELEVEIGHCATAGVPSFSAKIDSVGRTCTTAPACRAVEQADGAIASFACTGSLSCPVHTYPRVESLDLVVDAVKVLDYPMLEPELKKGIAPSDWLTGSLGDLVVLEDRVLVTAYPDAAFRRTDTASNVPTILVTLDPESMVVSSTRTANERGMMNIARDPYGPGFVGLFRRPDGPHVGRFSADGDLEIETSLGVGAARSPVTLVHMPAVDALLAISVITDGSEQKPDLVVFDAQTLSRRSVCQVDLIVHTIDVLALTDGSIAVSDDDGDEVLWLNPSTCEIDAYASGGAGNFSVGFLYPTEEMHAVILTTDASNSRGLHFVRPGSFPLPGSIFVGDDDAAVGTLAPFPGAPGRRLVAAIADTTGERRALLAEYIPDAPPRVLPSILEIGRGPALSPRLDAQGRLWMVMPWSSEVVRIAPK